MQFQPKYFPGWLLAALAIALPIALPTGLARNIGYVDPNLYIGYALNHSWLMSAGGYEYHATRIPFILMIEILFVFSKYIEFGFLFKAVALLSLGFVLSKLGHRLAISGLAKWMLITSILISPIAISISSWTIPNGWAAIFCLMLIVNSFNNEYKIGHQILGGMLFATCLLMNVYGALISMFAILIIKFVIREKNSNLLLKELMRYFLFSVTALALYELIWRYIWDGKTSLWMEHVKLFIDRDEVSMNYWGPVLNFSQQGVWTVLILGLAVPIYNLFSKRIVLTNVQKGCYSGSLSLTIVSIIAYFVKVNIAYTQFFYLYFYLPILVLTLFAAFSQLKTSSALYAGMLLSINFFIILVSSFVGINWLDSKKIALLIGLMFILTTLKSENSMRTQTQFTLSAALLGMILLFLIPPFMSGYSSEKNELNELLVQDQRKVFEEISKVPSNLGKVGTWYEPDEMGYRGAIISSLSFHLLRLEGTEENQPIPTIDSWQTRKGIIPDYLIAITSDEWNWGGEAKNQTMYKVKREIILPSQETKMFIFERSRGEN
jgi:hypothetical protein